MLLVAARIWGVPSVADELKGQFLCLRPGVTNTWKSPRFFQQGPLDSCQKRHQLCKKVFTVGLAAPGPAQRRAASLPEASYSVSFARLPPSRGPPMPPIAGI